MKKQNPIYSKETIQELNNQGFTLNMLADKYNVCPSSVGRALRKLGIEYNVQVRKIEMVIKLVEYVYLMEINKY